jgi:hypothetical protein
VQTTLLAAGIAIILALLTALVGPFFVNWSDYRGLFEARASQILGMPVRISGAIEARLLPTPSVKLRDVSVGSGKAHVLQPLTAQEIDAEFALGSLMRGEWRATELRIAGGDAVVKVGADGRILWHDVAGGRNAEALSVDRLVLQSSRVRIHDTAAPADGRIIDDVWFAGDAKSLMGPVKGEGGFVSSGVRYSFRLGLGRMEENGGRLRLAFAPVEDGLAAEADGTLTLDAGEARFEGVLRITHTGGVGMAGGRAVNKEQWTLASHIKASPEGILFQELDVQYGAEQRALRLRGAAELELGARPRLEAVVSARQLDLDRLVALPEATRRLPLVAVRAAIASLESALLPDIPVRLGIGVDALTVAGANVQMLRGDLVANARGWEIESIEFRAPGFTQVRASGRWLDDAQGILFAGPAAVESADPRALSAWIEGRSAIMASQAPPIGLLRASGALTLGPDRVAVDHLRAEIDRKEISGRFAYVWDGAEKQAKFDAEVIAAELDIDAAIRIVRTALPGIGADFPGELALALDIGRATVAGIEAKAVQANLRVDHDGVAFDRLVVGDLAGAALDMKGRIDGSWTSPRGSLSLDLNGERLDGVIAVIEEFSPRLAALLHPVASQLGPAKLRLGLEVDSEGSANAPQASARARIDGTAGALQIAATATMQGQPSAWGSARIDAAGRIETRDGRALVRLVRAEPAVSVDSGPGVFSWSLVGPLDGDVRTEMRMSARGLDAAAKGILRFDDAGPTGEGELALAASNVAALGALVGSGGQAVPVKLTTVVKVDPERFDFSALSGTVGSSPVSGSLSVALGAPLRLAGHIVAGAIDLPALAVGILGLPAQPRAGSAPNKVQPLWPTEPFGRSALAGLSGQVALSAESATLASDLTIRQFRGLLRFDDGETALEDVSGKLANGRLIANFVLPRSAAGTSIELRLALTEADIAALLPERIRAAARGRVSLQIEAKGTGRSPASLVGALGGTGSISFENVELSGLDPEVFDAAMRAADRGVDVDAARVFKAVGPALAQGRLRIARADGALAITAGQVRLGGLLAKGDRADLGVTAHLDLARWLVDARLNLVGRPGTDAPAAGRPEVFVNLRGPPETVERSIDSTALIGWLTLRAVDLQAKRLEVLEAERRALEAQKAAAEKAAAERAAAERAARERTEAERARANQERSRAGPAFPPVMTPDATPTPSSGIGAPAASDASPRAVPVAAPVAPTQEAISGATPGIGEDARGARPARTLQERAPGLPPPMNIQPVPRPIGPRPTPPRSDTRLPPPPAAAPARPLRLFDLFGAAR